MRKILTVCIIHGAEEFTVGQGLLFALTLLCGRQVQINICSITECVCVVSDTGHGVLRMQVQCVCPVRNVPMKAAVTWRWWSKRRDTWKLSMHAHKHRQEHTSIFVPCPYRALSRLSLLNH